MMQHDIGDSAERAIMTESARGYFRECLEKVFFF